MTTPAYDPLAENDPSEGYDRTLEDDASARRSTGEPEEKNQDEVSARPDRHWYPSDSDEVGTDDAASDTDSSDETDQPRDQGSDAIADDEHSSDDGQRSEYETYVAASSEVGGLAFADAVDLDPEDVHDNDGDHPPDRDASPTGSFDGVDGMRSFDEFDSSSTSDGTVEIGCLTDGLEGPRAELPQPVGLRAEMAFQDQVYDREQRDRAEQFRAEFLTFARQAQHAYPELAQAERWTADEVGRWWRAYRMGRFRDSISALERPNGTDGPVDM